MWPVMLIHDRANVSDSLCNPKSSHLYLWLSDTAPEPQLSPITHLIFLPACFTLDAQQLHLPASVDSVLTNNVQ